MRIRLLILALLVAIPAQAQQSAGFYLTSPLGVSAGRDSKFLSGFEERDDTVFMILPPTFSFIKLVPRGEFSLSYQPEFELFAENRDLNAWNHLGGVHFTYRIAPRLKLMAGDVFLATEDPTRWLADSFFLLPRTTYRENALFFNLDYELTPLTTLTFRFDNTITTTSLPGGGRVGLFDQVGNSFTAGVARRLTPRQRLRATYSFLKFTPLDKEDELLRTIASLTGPTHNVSLAYTFDYNPGLSFRIASGIVRAGAISYLIATEVEKRIGLLRLTASYNRYLSFFRGPRPRLALPGEGQFASGLLPNTLFQALRVTLRGQLTSRIGIEFRALGSRNSSELTERDIESLLGRLRLDYRLSDRLVAFANFEFYGQNLNELVTIPMARKRFFGGIEIVISRSPSPLEIPRRREEERERAEEEPGALNYREE